MPRLSAHGQVPLHWFATANGRALLEAEQARLPEWLAACSPHPWLWLRPLQRNSARPVLPGLPARGLCLHREGAAFAGAVRCGLPMPLASDTFGSIVIQHALDDGGLPAVLEEACRVLRPGGRLWLLTLNPFSPFRLCWHKAGLQTCSPLDWRARLQAAGLSTIELDEPWIGPLWRRPPRAAWLGPLRAVSLIGAEKRVLPLTPHRLRWRPQALPGAIRAHEQACPKAGSGR